MSNSALDTAAPNSLPWYGFKADLAIAGQTGYCDPLDTAAKQVLDRCGKVLPASLWGYDVGSEQYWSRARRASSASTPRASCSLKAAMSSASTVSIAYYDPALKQARLRYPAPTSALHLRANRPRGPPAIASLFASHRFEVVVHLAAQAGVRHSIDHPDAYVDANLEGFVNVLEGCRHNQCRHLVYASSSSVYGANSKVPFSVDDKADHPVSFYAATKRANELMAYSYSHLYRLPVTGLRFFTIYGPWGRPDMAIFLFTKAILEGTPVKLFNHGKMRRDFTHIDDVSR